MSRRVVCAIFGSSRPRSVCALEHVCREHDVHCTLRGTNFTAVSIYSQNGEGDGAGAGAAAQRATAARPEGAMRSRAAGASIGGRASRTPTPRRVEACRAREAW